MKHKYFYSLITFFLFTLISYNSYSQSVVINEIVTDPQSDWSTNGFNGTAGAGTISNVDEYIELYIKTSGLDLTGWTIELLDGTNVTGNLTSSGAFDVSNYLTSGSGTFTNTEVGDYLVLGNVDGSGAMNNSITINLKNSGGTIIDTVTLGGGSGEAPSGNASSTANEAVIRTLNGDDTNINNSDFSQGASSIGSSNSNTKNWLGKTDNDWGTASNWEGNSTPAAAANVYITNGLTNYPTTGAIAVTTNTVTIASGATLLAKNATSFTGTVTYNRSINFVSGNLKGWYLMASPVVGETYNDAYNTANNIISSGTNRGIATYNTSLDTWTYLQALGSGTFNSGQGYSIKRGTSNGTIGFTGTLNTNNAGVDRVLTTTGNRFNLLGNPYTSYINSVTFLNNEASISNTKTLWVWNQTLGSNGAYEVKNIVSAFVVAPSQGFFVQANVGGGTFNFAESNQSHNGTDTFQRNTMKEFKLNISDGTIHNYTKVYYLNNATTGYDVGYDGEMFSGTSNSFAVYTHLVSNSQGKNYQIQSLPNSSYENMIIPVGVNAESGKEITFTATEINMPVDIKVYLEDKVTNTFTRLDQANSEYKITLNEDLSGIGRFYLHTSSQVLSNDSFNLDTVSIYKTNNSNLRIVGLSNGKASVNLFNILGKEVLKASFTANSINDINLPELKTGVYIVQLITEQGKINKKIIIE